MKRTAVGLVLAALLVAAPAEGATLVRLDGIGPLKLGQSRTSALATGWLAGRHPGCTLGGKPYPIDYTLKGSEAPAGIGGTAEFVGGKLTNLSFDKGVRTTRGVVPGRTTWAGMVTRYREAGFRVSARYDSTFRGTFVSVKRTRRGPQILGGFAGGRVLDVIGVPYVPVCE